MPGRGETDDGMSGMGEERQAFQAEVGRILDLMVHSVYSNKEIFLRELISNASDACDKLRYAAIAEPGLLEDDPDLAVTLSIDSAERLIRVADNGIGMNRDDLIENLGTIAHSGTEAFIAGLGNDDAENANLIGQFGVGFYSAFMVADEVVVTSARAGAAQVQRCRRRFPVSAIATRCLRRPWRMSRRLHRRPGMRNRSRRRTGR